MAAEQGLTSVALRDALTLRQISCFLCLAFWGLIGLADSQKIALPNFADLRRSYPGYHHHGGLYRNHELLNLLGVHETKNIILRDTSALRLSFSLNQIGGVHSLGTQLIRLSKFGQDSITGKDNLQYIYLPIAFGPYLADKYGYPNISKLHLTDPVQTRNIFWGKQGILRVITYTQHGNQPKGHVALWDCNHFHESKDWISENSLLTVEFWESPDSNCPGVALQPEGAFVNNPYGIPPKPVNQLKLLTVLSDQSKSSSHRFTYLKTHLIPNHARHSSKKLRLMGLST